MKKKWWKRLFGRRKERRADNATNSIIEPRTSGTSRGIVSGVSSGSSPHSLRDQPASTFQAQASSAISISGGPPDLQNADIAPTRAPTVHDAAVTPVSGNPSQPHRTSTKLPVADPSIIAGEELADHDMPDLQAPGDSALPPPILRQTATTKATHLHRPSGTMSVNQAGMTIESALAPMVSMFEGASHFQLNDGTIYGIQDINTVRAKIVPMTAEEILKTMSTNKFHMFHSDNLARQIPGTGVWFIESQDLQSWMAGESECKIFWVTGISGTGKTVLAALVIAKLQEIAKKTPEMSVAYAYCQYSESMTFVDLLVALVNQLLEQNSSLAGLAEKAFNAPHTKQAKPTQEQLLKLLQDIAVQCKQTFYVLEALDEAPKHLQSSIVDSLASINFVSIFVTSRRLEHLEESFSKVALFRNVQAHDDDIDLLVDYRIANSPRLGRIIKTQSLRDEIGQKVKENCGGSFLHASLQIEALQQCMSLSEMKQAIKTFSPEVNDFYAGTVQRMGNKAANESGNGPRPIQRAMMGLLWIVFANGSLTAEELRTAMSFKHSKQRFDLDDIVAESDLPGLFCGLVTVDQTSKRVRLIHYTAHDYIKTYLEELYGDPHAILAGACISLLSDHNIAHFESETPDDFNTALDKTPLLRYSHTEWAWHARHSGETFRRDVVVPFIQKCSSYPFIVKPSTRGHLERLSPPHVAVLVNSPDVVQSIYDSITLDAVSPSEGLTPLMLAAFLGHKEVIPLLLAQPWTNVNTTRKKQHLFTALALALVAGHVDIVRILLATLGMKVAAQNEFGGTSLMFVAVDGDKAMVQPLLDHGGIDVNAHSALESGSETALTLASQNGHIDVVRSLLATLEIDVAARNSYGWTALMSAAANGHAAVVQLLLDRGGIDVNAHSTLEDGSVTALIVASANGHSDVVRALLDAPHISLDDCDGDNNSALSIARKQGHEDVVQLLEQAAAASKSRISTT